MENLLKLKQKIVQNGNIPKHIALIMDGNGRWAKSCGKERVLGHKEGVGATRRVIDIANEVGVSFLTLYTFSKENWNRPEFEVNALMSLLVDTLVKEIDSLMEKNIKVQIIGAIEDLPEHARASMENAIAKTSQNEGMTLFIALSYSGRAEIVRAVNHIIKENKNSVIDEKTFSDYLYTGGVPDPELLIRTGGEFRVSNFLLWQIAYSEFFVMDKFWPEFKEEDLLLAIDSFQHRERRFGKTTEQIVNQK